VAGILERDLSWFASLPIGAEVFVYNIGVAKTGNRFTAFCPPCKAIKMSRHHSNPVGKSSHISIGAFNSYPSYTECFVAYESEAYDVIQGLDDKIAKIQEIKSRILKSLVE